MKTTIEVLPIIREQVKAGVFESEDEAVMEYKIARERFDNGIELKGNAEEIGKAIYRILTGKRGKR